ncbi:hypothetical protein O1611_g1294 [Lasiodiplodia mahajangana]|uniref:Uncharacterized protein n=1 Tax=Lasiodiplodia mahajangana TaxID=1108764 RepID=A0ACC2JXZ9_9PEZI|nr:hypothetical protein O1611_g1294 [Lasiodiplodia mahajangana]
MSSDSESSAVGEEDWEPWLHLQNHIWRDYREKGDVVDRLRDMGKTFNFYKNPANRPLLPTDNVLRYFDNRKWSQKPYATAFYSGSEIESSTQSTDGDIIVARTRYEEVKAYFQDKTRYVAQKVLGAGGNGLAVHFRDTGPKLEIPERDIVVKVALAGWQWTGIEKEKRMMRKVKDSAHCVQIIDPPVIGMDADKRVTLPLQREDSSVDGDSSGNESLTSRVIRRRYNKPKRPSRRTRQQARQQAAKERRKKIRVEQIEKEIRKQEKAGTRKDYIAMEYMQYGTLGSLIAKRNDCPAKEEKYSRIPNRVLWEFWLCLIRACIAMEYPPRKFHPHRSRHKALYYRELLKNNMLRTCQSLGIKIFGDPKGPDSESSLYDLNENLPTTEEKRERIQNMVHFDLDPSNIFIAGFQIDQGKPEQLEEAQGDSDSQNSDSQNPAEVMRPDDRVHDEHVLVPRLKVGDFGVSRCVKREKRNEYYHELRRNGKHGEHPPESFGPEWEKIEVKRDGNALAESRICGYYSNKTNIWGIAMSMWELITGYEPPVPPEPQPPYSEVDLYPPINNLGQTLLDGIFEDPQYVDFKISYCALLLDPREGSRYSWVDEALRDIIFQCLYHKPDDRPTLEELQNQAELALQPDTFPEESDNYIRDWIDYWFNDAVASQSSSPGSAVPPAPQGGIAGPSNAAPPDIPMDLEALVASIAQEDPNNPVRLAMQYRFNADFPHGWERIFNAATKLRCGLIALSDSLLHQLGLNPAINGVRINLTRLPTPDDLLKIHSDILKEGKLNEYVGADVERNSDVSLDILAVILQEWGAKVNIQLQLGVKLENRDGVFVTSSPHDNPKIIWIWNDNIRDLAVLEGDGPQQIPERNHFEGLRAKSPPPPPPDVEEDLPDYEDDLPDYEDSE